MIRKPARPRHGTIVAYLALFVALGGTSYAAVTLSKNSVRSKHIKNGQVKKADVGTNAVNSSKVADGTLLSRDFKAGELVSGAPGPQGLTGAQGPKGDTGAKGDTGPSGRSALTPLASGETIRGVIGLDDQAPGAGDFRISQTFQIPAPSAVPNSAVDVNDHDEVAGRCTGTVDEPTAPAGVVCVYVHASANANSIEGRGAPDGTDGSKYGFQVTWTAPVAGDTLVNASWAYTAP